jgi:hypothetical protein
MWIVRRVLAPRVNFFTTLDENEIGLGCHAKADGVLVGKVIFLLFRARLVHPMEKKKTCSSGFVIEVLCVVLAVICVVTDGVFTAKLYLFLGAAGILESHYLSPQLLQ